MKAKTQLAPLLFCIFAVLGADEAPSDVFEQTVNSQEVEIIGRSPAPQDVDNGYRGEQPEALGRGPMRWLQPPMTGAGQYLERRQAPPECCRFPACFDSVYEMCVDTCLPSDCATRTDVRTAWTVCPAHLTLPDCAADSLAPTGRLPLECYPDVADVLPGLALVPKAASPWWQRSSSAGAERKGDHFRSGAAHWEEDAGGQEQLHRREIRQSRQKTCSRGLCRQAVDNARPRK